MKSKMLCVGWCWTDCCETQVKWWSRQQEEEIFPQNIKLNHIWSNFSITGNTQLGFSQLHGARIIAGGPQPVSDSVTCVHGTWGIKNIILPPDIGISSHQSKLGAAFLFSCLYCCVSMISAAYCADVSDPLKLYQTTLTEPNTETKDCCYYYYFSGLSLSHCCRYESQC